MQDNQAKYTPSNATVTCLQLDKLIEWKTLDKTKKFQHYFLVKFPVMTMENGAWGSSKNVTEGWQRRSLLACLSVWKSSFVFFLHVLFSSHQRRECATNPWKHPVNCFSRQQKESQDRKEKWNCLVTAQPRGPSVFSLMLYKLLNMTCDCWTVRRC